MSKHEIAHKSVPAGKHNEAFAEIDAGSAAGGTTGSAANGTTDGTAGGKFDAIAYINEPRWHSSRLGLERISQLLDALGRPQDSLRFVHVAGTNGKGSTCAYLASILQAAGLRTGLFTSPYIERFEERIRVDGADISPEDLTRATLEVREVAERMEEHPTEFELMCAVAMLHFKRSKCDIVVLEVGLGGRFDATNVIASPEVCAITKIGLDHTNILGNSIDEIAAEKARIVKPGCALATCPQESGAARAIEAAAEAAGVQVRTSDFSQLSIRPLRLESRTPAVRSKARTPQDAFSARECDEDAYATAHEGACAQDVAIEPAEGAGMQDVMVSPAEGAPATMPLRQFNYRGKGYSTRLLASYQPQNAALAIDAATLLAERGWSIPQSAIERGIREAEWPGRFEVVRESPLFIVDGSHNAQGAQALAATIEELLPNVQPVLLIGVLADKDRTSILNAIAGIGGGFVTIAPPNPRALDAQSLADEIAARIGKRAANGRNISNASDDTPHNSASTVASRNSACASTAIADATAEPTTPQTREPSTAKVIAAESIADGVELACKMAGPDGVVIALGSLYSIGSIKAALRNA